MTLVPCAEVTVARRTIAAQPAMVLCDLIDEQREMIIDHCMQLLQARYPSQTRHELRQGVSAFLDELVVVLRADVDPRSLSCAQLGIGSSARLTQRFDLDRIVHDYGIVCDTIAAVAERSGWPPTLREFQILYRCVDVAIASSVETLLHQRTYEHASYLTELIGEIRDAITSASMAHALVRSGKVPPDGRTSDLVDRSLAQIAERLTLALVDAELLAPVMTHKQRVRVAELFAKVMDEVVVERGIRFVPQVDPALELEVDVELFGRALREVARNAVRFTRPGEPVMLRAMAAEDGVMIEVEDRCGGITGEAEHVLGPRREVGLGVVIARRIAEAHDGSLVVRVIPEVGCVFAIKIPQSAATSARSPRGSRDSSMRDRPA